jgi:hypothetical protein
MPVPRKKQRPRRRRQQQQRGDGFFDDLGNGFANLIGLKRGDNFGKAFLKGVIAPLIVGVKGAKEVLDTLHSTTGEKPSSSRRRLGDRRGSPGRRRKGQSSQSSPRRQWTRQVAKGCQEKEDEATTRRSSQAQAHATCSNRDIAGQQTGRQRHDDVFQSQ